MDLEKIIIIFACVALALTVATVTLLVVDAYFHNGKFYRRIRRVKKTKPVKASRPMPLSPMKVRRPAPARAAGRFPNGAMIGVFGGLLSGVLVAAYPFFGKKNRRCSVCCSANCRCGRRRGVRTYRF
ncbi:MAG: hypothetical protein E7620_00430 [Ruminococcaceae bacterium]|nr:hypothetical protein [Oscillospiraceae bacterium]